jgi:hypothetical protein
MRFYRILLVLGLVTGLMADHANAQTWTQINTTSFTVLGARNISWDSIYSGVDYKLVMRGVWRDCSNTGICGYDTRFIYAGGVVNFNANYFIEGPAYLRNTAPTPNTYDATTHTYNVFFTGADTLIWLEYHDNGYGDNAGTVYFDLYTDCTFPSFTAPDDVTICAGETVSLTASGGLRYRWYDEAIGGTLLASTASLTTPPLGSTTTYHVSSYYQSGCESARQAVTVTVQSCPNEWTGATSTDWNTDSNWGDGEVPTVADDVVIPDVSGASGNFPVVSTAGAEANSVTVNSAATLSIAATGDITIHGDLANAGTVIVGSEATGIGSLITLGTVSGAGVFQADQYLLGAGGPTPNGVFQYVSSPVVGATSTTYDAEGTNKLWSASEVQQDFIEIIEGSTVLNVGEGYVARLGDEGALSLYGTSFNTGNITISGLTRTGMTAPNRGYNLIGNPYPSSVDWNDVDTTNLFGTIWYRTHDAGNNMMVSTYNAANGQSVGMSYTGAPTTGIIPPGQAFWVRVKNDNSSATVSFTNAMRVHGSQANIYKQEAEEGTVRLLLNNGITSDETLILFSTAAEDSFEHFDSHKMWTANAPQLYTTIAADTTVINSLYSIETNPIVDLGIKAPTTGNYTITATSITLTEEVWLEDRLLNNFQHLNLNPVYAFSSNAGNMGDRFALHFGALAVGIGRDVACNVCTHVFAADGVVNVSVGNDITTGTITILDMTGRTVQTAAINSSRTVIATAITPGIYLVRVETEKGVETHRVMLR